MASRRRRRQVDRGRRRERQLLWASLAVAAVLATMLATGIGVRDDTDEAGPPTTARPVAAPDTTPERGLPTPPSSAAPAPALPPPSAPADLGCAAAASLAELQPAQTRLSQGVRAASESPNDGALFDRAMRLIEEHRSLHLARFRSSLTQLGAAEPALAEPTELVARTFERSLAVLARATNGSALAAASAEVVAEPDLAASVSALGAIWEYAANRCGIGAEP